MSDDSLVITFTPVTDMFTVICKRKDTVFTSTFDGGQTGFDILQENIAKCIRSDFVPSAMEEKLRKIYGPVIYSSTKGSSLNDRENEFIIIFSQLLGESKPAEGSREERNLLVEMSEQFKTWYDNINDVKEKQISIQRLKSYFTNHRDIEQKVLTDKFKVKGFGGFIYGKGIIELDPVFAPLFPQKSLGGSRKTFKKRT